MKIFLQKLLRGFTALTLVLIVCIGAVYVLAATVKPVREWLHDLTQGTMFERFLPHDDEDAPDELAKNTAAPVQEQAVEISFSSVAARNMGIGDSAITTVEVVDYYKSLSFPAVVVERPGFSTITVPSPVSGVVTKIYHESGVAIAPGEPLFDILLNQQEVVKAQTEFLALLKKREINSAELQRLADLDPQIVPKQRRELDYEKIQIDSEIEIQKNLLLLQGLSESDVANSLEKTGRIIRSMTVYAPSLEQEHRRLMRTARNTSSPSTSFSSRPARTWPLAIRSVNCPITANSRSRGKLLRSMKNRSPTPWPRKVA